MTQVEAKPFDPLEASDEEMDNYLQKSADHAAGLDEQSLEQTDQAVDAMHKHEAQVLGKVVLGGDSQVEPQAEDQNPDNQPEA